MRIGLDYDNLDSDIWFTSPTVPPLPQAPTNCFERDEIITQSLDQLVDLTSVILSGAVGIGKTIMALTILYHSRVKAKFGDNRHFMRCDNLVNSSESFLQRLSSEIGFSPTKSMQLLRPRLARCPPLLLVLDSVDCVLDPLAAESAKIFTMIEEIRQYKHVCILATSRMAINVPGFHTIEVTTLSREGARDTFYSLCHLKRSSAIDDVIENLDFHPLSINLLATAVSDHGWDEPKLLQDWGGRAGLLRTDCRRSLEAGIESALGSPTIQSLGPVARETLEAISAYPCGVEETRVGRMFPTMGSVAEAVNVLCEFHLVDRHDGFVKILSPFRLYFLERALTIFHPHEDGENRNHSGVKQEEHDDRCHEARAGSSPN